MHVREGPIQFPEWSILFPEVMIVGFQNLAVWLCCACHCSVHCVNAVHSAFGNYHKKYIYM